MRRKNSVLQYFFLLFEPLHDLSSTAVNQTDSVTATSRHNASVSCYTHTHVLYSGQFQHKPQLAAPPSLPFFICASTQHTSKLFILPRCLPQTSCVKCHISPVSYDTDCLEHKCDMSSFHNFTGNAKETFELVL